VEDVELRDFYKGKKVFVTGHTGFKGAWLCWYLKELGAEVTAYSLAPYDRRGNLFNQTNLGENVTSIFGDLDDLPKLTKALVDSKAEIVLHLAAQPLVLTSYEDPVGTFRSNALGTVHMLEAVRQADSIKSAVIITTDKCYENKEWEWPYRETDELGGYDPYSSSKAMAEIATSSYYRSFFKDKNIGVATARAGNVIGGGDFADYRIVPDIVESILNNEDVTLRHPDSTRPWQHVLDALYGYMLLAMKAYNEPKEYSLPFNFAPDTSSNYFTVEVITQTFINILNKGGYKILESSRRGHEAKFLRLDSSRANTMLNWRPRYQTEDAIRVTAEWFKDYIEQKDLREITIAQIKNHIDTI
jgi:CDP-glucose 4,6-dehydratase